MFSIDIISIENITIGNTIIPQETSEYIFISSLILFGVCIFLSGLVFTYLNIEERTLKI